MLDSPALARSPLSLISAMSSERRGAVKGAPLLRGLRTLDRSPPFWNLEPEGKGAGGLRGLAPWRSMRQSLMRAFSAPRRSIPGAISFPSHALFGLFFCPLTSPRAIVAMLPSALCLQLPPQVPAGVLNSRGAAISVTNCRVPVAWFPSFCRDLAVTPTRRFRILRGSSILSKSRSLCCFGFLFSLLDRFPVVQRIVHFPSHPQLMQQDRQLSRYRHRRFLLPPLAAFLPTSRLCARLHFRQPPRLQIAIRRPVAQNAVRCLYQQPSQQHVPGFADPQLRLAVAAVPLLPRQSQVRPYVPAVFEALCIFQRQDEGQRNQRPHSIHLLQQLRLRVSFLDLLDLLVVHSDLFGNLFHALE